jgi:hypothetical protein
MFDFNIIVGARQRKPGCGFQCTATRVIELGDKLLQIDASHVVPRILDIMPGCRDPGDLLI